MRAQRSTLLRLLPVLVGLAAVVVLAAAVWVLPPFSFERMLAGWGAMLVTAAVVVRAGSEAGRAGQVEARSGVDPTTGLPTTRVFHEALGRALVDADESHPVSLILLDLDDFEQANAVSGYEEGDALLARAARVMMQLLQGDEAVFRLGGDEFAVLLADSDAGPATVFAEHLLATLRTIEDSSGVPLRASAGVAACPTHTCARDRLVQAAERALFAAKFAGKDRVAAWDPEMADHVDPGELERRARDLSYLATVRATALAVDARIAGHAGHSRHVGAMSLRLARRLGLDDATTRLVEIAGQVHDVGKVGVPDSVLQVAPETLTGEPRRRLHEHPILGATIVASARLPEVPPWIAAHHERWDGTGYPEGRSGEDIPLAARILAVADGYDHLLASLPPSARRHQRTAVAEQMRAEMGGAYDPLVVLHLLSVIAEEEVGAR
jgi:diguanylate cyclase (GGDEF)-like protein